MDDLIQSQLRSDKLVLRLQNRNLQDFPIITNKTKEMMVNVEALNLENNPIQNFQDLAEQLDQLFPFLRYLRITIDEDEDVDEQMIQELIVIGNLEALNDLCLDEDETEDDYLKRYPSIIIPFDDSLIVQASLDST